MEDAKYADKHEEVFIATETTVDQWFESWIENIVGDLAPNTIHNSPERCIRNIQPVMGKMYLSNVKPTHFKKVLIPKGSMFNAAKMNDLIRKHSMDGVRYTKPARAKDDIKFLTRDEQRIFLEQANHSVNGQGLRNPQKCLAEP